MSRISEKSCAEANIAEVFITFLKLGLTSFGGPIAHIGYFRKEVVEKKHWISESQFSQLLIISQFLPGPASSQLGFSIGLLKAGWAGAIAAFFAFTLPSALLLILFASALPSLSGELGEAAIHGLKLVACAVVADAVVSMFKKLCPDMQRRFIAIMSTCALLFISISWFQIIVVIGGAVIGTLLCKESISESKNYTQVMYGRRFGLILFSVFLSLLIILILSPNSAGLYGIAQAFYQAGALVFGGGHVVLPLLENSVVSTGWISSADFLAGYGAAQAVPGPMFSFAAYLGAIIPTGYTIWLGSIVALLFMFLPGLLLVAAILPIWQAISNNQTAANAIAGVSASVVGILAAALYDPIFTSEITSTSDVIIVIISFCMLAFGKCSPLVIVVWSLIACMLSVVL